MDPCRHLMFAPASVAWIDIATDLGIPLIAKGGLGALTPAAIAKPAGCSRQAVHQQLGSAEAMRRAVAARFLARWSRWVDVRAYLEGITGLLPDTEEVTDWVRVWLACCAYTATDTEVARWVADVHASERAVVRSALTRFNSSDNGPAQIPDGVTATLQATVTGLRVARCHFGAPFEEVRSTLDATLGLVRQEDPPAVA